MSRGNRGITLEDILQPDRVATEIANKYQTWETLRGSWLSEKNEIRQYIFATDTAFTSNGDNPWKNRTHIPKLCQIRDNLIANYSAALFPNDAPIKWEGDDESSEAYDKRMAIEAYMNNKMRQSDFRLEVNKILGDFVDFGNCFGITTFVAQKTTDPTTGEITPGYVGPKLERVSPLDIVFNPTASSFEDTPKIVRSLKTLVSLKADIDEYPDMGYMSDVFDKAMECRHQFMSTPQSEFARNQEMQVSGFSNYMAYFESDYVEVLDFYGDFYDIESKKFYKNYMITVIDRSHVIRMIPNPSWLGKAAIFHAGWRPRHDNLYAMGPLDNLVGMQYRIDHLENAKADGFDLIVHPIIKVTGLVEDFDYEPEARIFCGDEGDVEFMRPDTTMLAADTQIQMYEAQMEEMAGAPKQAMGFRTPGEKTAYEVQVLENGANRIFLNKTAYFEEVFLEKVVNSMLEISRRSMGEAEYVRVLDNDFAVVNFLKITKADITARGKLRPIGARHYARNANLMQNITQFYSTLGQDPAVSAHISGKAVAKIGEQLLDLERFQLVRDNVRVEETLETQKLMQSGSQILAERGAPADPNMAPPVAGASGTPASTVQ